jgi:uncharacterized protein
MKTHLSLAGETVHLLPSAALFLAAQQCLLVADMHLGKASTFRQLGVPVPSGTTQETLDALSQDMASTQAQHVVFLGDFLHSKRAHSASTLTALAHWRTQHTALRITLVRGNHDDRAGDPPAALGFEVVNEPLLLGPFALCHHPQLVSDHYCLAGHWHPCITLHGKGRERLRLPCFWLGDPVLRPIGILPAYGSFTGMHPIERRGCDQVYAVAGDTVQRV